MNQIEPFAQCILGMLGIIGISQPLLYPSHNKVQLRRLAPQDICNDLIHFIRPLFDDLVPVHVVS